MVKIRLRLDLPLEIRQIQLRPDFEKANPVQPSSKIDMTSVVYEMNSTAPSTEPCGTLQVTGIGLDFTALAQNV